MTMHGQMKWMRMNEIVSETQAVPATTTVETPSTTTSNVVPPVVVPPAVEASPEVVPSSGRTIGFR